MLRRRRACRPVASAHLMQSLYYSEAPTQLHYSFYDSCFAYLAFVQLLHGPYNYLSIQAILSLGYSFDHHGIQQPYFHTRLHSRVTSIPVSHNTTTIYDVVTQVVIQAVNQVAITVVAAAFEARFSPTEYQEVVAPQYTPPVTVPVPSTTLQPSAKDFPKTFENFGL